MSTVLIIDDDELMEHLYVRAFTFGDFTVSVAHDGEEGVAEAIRITPDVILLDIMMPKLNGLQALEQLKQNPVTKKIPVIMLTNISSGTIEAAQKAVDMGAERYIVKSDYDPADVVTMTRKVLLQKSDLAVE